ncbi:hypothetical protein [Burkholderia ambifaria]|uniref:hypothetical protein n=1 Tax=Burkholderia ambifaria TaxID=152480 RepID=UPI003390B036
MAAFERHRIDDVFLPLGITLDHDVVVRLVVQRTGGEHVARGRVDLREGPADLHTGHARAARRLHHERQRGLRACPFERFIDRRTVEVRRCAQAGLANAFVHRELVASRGRCRERVAIRHVEPLGQRVGQLQRCVEAVQHGPDPQVAQLR